MQRKTVFPENRIARRILIVGVFIILIDYCVQGTDSFISVYLFDKLNSLTLDGSQITGQSMWTSSGNARMAVYYQMIKVITSKPLGCGFTNFYNLLNVLYGGNAAGARLLIYFAAMGVIPMLLILFPIFNIMWKNKTSVYGKAYCKIANPTIVNNELNLGIGNADEGQSRNITHSFAEKLQKLMLGEEVEITLCDAQGATQKYKFTDTERMTFVLFGILYASRCNNFHGNVAARMNSIRADKKTFRMYTDIFLLEYIVLVIHMNSQGNLSDTAIDKVKDNANLMI